MGKIRQVRFQVVFQFIYEGQFNSSVPITRRVLQYCAKQESLTSTWTGHYQSLCALGGQYLVDCAIQFFGWIEFWHSLNCEGLLAKVNVVEEGDLYQHGN